MPQVHRSNRAPSMQMDTLGIEPRASRMLSGCDTTTPCALSGIFMQFVTRKLLRNSEGKQARRRGGGGGEVEPTASTAKPLDHGRPKVFDGPPCGPRRSSLPRPP